MPAIKGSIPWNKGTKGIMKSWNKGKTNKEIFGIERAKEISDKIRASKLNKPLSSEHRTKVIQTLVPFKKGNKLFLGRHHTKEWKEIASRRMAGPNNPLYGKPPRNKGTKGLQFANKTSFKKGEKPWITGKHHKKESLEKMSKSQIERFKNKENHPRWMGGVSFEPYSIEFNAVLKNKTKQRDNYVCQLCGISESQSKKKYGRILAVNHIDYNKKNSNEGNLITLCIACNSRVNINRDYWTMYFYDKLKNRGRLNA